MTNLNPKPCLKSTIDIYLGNKKVQCGTKMVMREGPVKRNINFFWPYKQVYLLYKPDSLTLRQ